MRKRSKILFLALLIVMLVPAGIAALADNAPTQTSGTDIVISQEVLDKIKATAPADYDRNVANYRNLLVSLQVHPSFQQEIEKLIMEGYALPEILISYEYLYDNFGKAVDLRSFVAKQSAGLLWKDIFTEYNRGKAEFKPRSFDSDYLEQLTKTPSITSDDIMIADRLAFTTDRPFKEVIDEKQATPHWQTITAKAGILFSGDTLPRVQITNQQMQTYRDQGGLTDDQIAEAFVIAHKVGKDAKDIIAEIKEGYTVEAIYAQSYQEKYL